MWDDPSQLAADHDDDTEAKNDVTMCGRSEVDVDAHSSKDDGNHIQGSKIVDNESNFRCRNRSRLSGWWRQEHRKQQKLRNQQMWI